MAPMVRASVPGPRVGPTRCAEIGRLATGETAVTRCYAEIHGCGRAARQLGTCPEIEPATVKMIASTAETLSPSDDSMTDKLARVAVSTRAGRTRTYRQTTAPERRSSAGGWRDLELHAGDARASPSPRTSMARRDSNRAPDE